MLGRVPKTSYSSMRGAFFFIFNLAVLCICSKETKVIFVFPRFQGGLKKYSGPANVAVNKHSRTDLTCVSPNINASSWFRGTEEVYRGRTPSKVRQKDARFDLDVDAHSNVGKYNLVLNNTKLSDGTNYGCHLNTQQIKKGHAHLIILDDEFSCKFNESLDDLAEGDTLMIECSISFQGFWGPNITMESDRSKLQVQNTDSGDDWNSLRTIRRVSISHLTAQDNGARYTFSVFFLSPPPIRGLPEAMEVAFNAPPYPDESWWLHLDVQYGPRNLTVSREVSESMAELTLMCWADGNPQLTYGDYRWEKLDSSLLVVEKVSGNRLVLGFPVNQSLYRCVATNLVKGLNRSNTIIITVEKFHVPTIQTTTYHLTSQAASTREILPSTSGLTGEHQFSTDLVTETYITKTSFRATTTQNILGSNATTSRQTKNDNAILVHLMIGFGGFVLILIGSLLITAIVVRTHQINKTRPMHCEKEDANSTIKNTNEQETVSQPTIELTYPQIKESNTLAVNLQKIPTPNKKATALPPLQSKRPKGTKKSRKTLPQYFPDPSI